ncbi:MAG: desulfoferrodoxin family protein [Lachnospiraceae bacterium]
MSVKLFRCNHCGNIVGSIFSSGAPLTCCGDKMEELQANVTDAAQEKHVPVIEVNGNAVVVKVGSAPHPMLEEHFIQWIILETSEGVQRKTLSPGEAPERTFFIGPDEKVIAAYEYCNLHGLWKKEA